VEESNVSLYVALSSSPSCSSSAALTIKPSATPLLKVDRVLLLEGGKTPPNARSRVVIEDDDDVVPISVGVVAFVIIIIISEEYYS